MNQYFSFWTREGNLRPYWISEDGRDEKYKGKIIQQVENLEVILRDEKDINKRWRHDCPSSKMLYDGKNDKLLGIYNNVSLSKTEGGIRVYMSSLNVMGAAGMGWVEKRKKGIYDGKDLKIISSEPTHMYRR